jgi:hypothetical protein
MQLRFKDRFFTPPVAKAMLSPLAIVLAGVGTAAGILVGLPVVAALGIGAAAWAGRVLVAVPRSPRSDRIDPFALSEPWRRYVAGALAAKGRYDEVVRSMTPGPLKDRLRSMGTRLQDGVDDSWRIARRGHELQAAIRRLNTAAAESRLAMVRAELGDGSPSEATALTIASLEAQIQSANRLRATAQDAQDRLRLLDARFDELVARAVEVSVGTIDEGVLVSDVDEVVTELEALRMAIEATEQAEQPGSGLPPLP